jgi:DNA-binding transcriptional ArsR family regulator
LLASGALASGDIAKRFVLTAPAISQHLKTLRDAKLVRMRPERQRRIYELDPEGFRELSDWVNNIGKFWANKLDALEDALHETRRTP